MILSLDFKMENIYHCYSLTFLCKVVKDREMFRVLILLLLKVSNQTRFVRVLYIRFIQPMPTFKKNIYKKVKKIVGIG
jgi:hypothetical protein